MAAQTKTSIYKVVCKDLLIKNTFIGSSRNLSTTAREYKIIINNGAKHKPDDQYMFATVKANGGFAKWDLILIEEFTYKNRHELAARIRYHVEQLGASLNLPADMQPASTTPTCPCRSFVPNPNNSTISLKVGSGSTKTISIDSVTSSLNHIAKAINSAGAGVTASVVKQSGATPYRLVLTSNSTGTDNGITISADSGNATLSALFSGASTITTASNAALTIGQGASAITLESASNTFADVAPGVSLTVKKAGDVTVTVGTDSTKAKEAITSFVTDHNDALTYLKENSGYDSDTKSAGVLIQESDLRNGVNQLTRALIASVPGLPSTRNSAAQMGISFNYEDGIFEIDETELDAALADDPGGVAALIQNGGTSTSTGVSFGALSGKNKTTTPFRVNRARRSHHGYLRLCRVVE